MAKRKPKSWVRWLEFYGDSPYRIPWCVENVDDATMFPGCKRKLVRVRITLEPETKRKAKR